MNLQYKKCYYEDGWIAKDHLRILSTSQIDSQCTHLYRNAPTNIFRTVPKHLNHSLIEFLFFLQMLYSFHYLLSIYLEYLLWRSEGPFPSIVPPLLYMIKQCAPPLHPIYEKRERTRYNIAPMIVHNTESVSFQLHLGHLLHRFHLETNRKRTQRITA